MSEAVQKLLPTLLALPDDQRAALRDALEESLADPNPDLVAELDRRWAAVESGEDPGVDADEVLARLREKYQ